MRSLSVVRLAMVVSALFVAGACSTALAADEWPGPPSGWWEVLRAGDSATFEMESGERRVTSKITIIGVDGQFITFSTQTRTEKGPEPEHIQTVDARSPEAGGSAPPDAVIIEGTSEVYEAGGSVFDCTKYEVMLKDLAIEVCHSAQLPVIYNGGNVWLETSVEDMVSTIRLKEYTGEMLGK